jgi:hypothetical protein
MTPEDLTIYAIVTIAAAAVVSTLWRCARAAREMRDE